jgi:hypothetical protein
LILPRFFQFGEGVSITAPVVSQRLHISVRAKPEPLSAAVKTRMAATAPQHSETTLNFASNFRRFYVDETTEQSAFFDQTQDHVYPMSLGDQDTWNLPFASIIPEFGPSQSTRRSP